MVKHCALTKINSVTVDTETDPGLGCATSARLPNMWPVAGNPVVRAPQGNYGIRGVKPCPGQDPVIVPRSARCFYSTLVKHCALTEVINPISHESSQSTANLLRVLNRV